jgi:hypothetical protein
MLLALQRTAGNRAVQRLVATSQATIAAAAARPGAALVDTPVAKPAPNGAAEIKKIESRAGGVTSMDPGQIPSLDLEAPARGGDGTYTAKVKPTTATPPAIESYYPAQGLHDLATTNAAGCRELLWVTDDMSALIKQGEQEHIDDYLWAYRLSYQAAAAAVAQAAAGAGGTGPTAGEAQDSARAQVRDALPSKLRPPDTDFQIQWMRTFGKLCGATYERDNLGWHSLSRYYIHDPKELKKLPLPTDGCNDVSAYVKGGKIGEVSSEKKVREKYDSLPG